MPVDRAAALYKVIVSPAGQYSVVAADQKLPAPWTDTGHHGSAIECAQYISMRSGASRRSSRQPRPPVPAAAPTDQPIIQAEQGVVTGSLPLTPQIAGMLHLLDPKDVYSWAIVATLLEVPHDLNLALFRRAVEQLLLHHDALRLRFECEGLHARLWIAEPDGTIPFSSVDLSGLPEAERGPAVELKVAEYRSSLNLVHGPVFRIVFFYLGADRPGRLLILVHHIAIDGYSPRILSEDLWSSYEQLCRGKAVRLPRKSVSIKQWSEYMHSYIQTDAAKQEFEYWMSLPWSRAKLPVDRPGHATVATEQHHVVGLSVEETRALIKRATQPDDTNMMDLLLTALLLTFTQWTGQHFVQTYLMGHGRDFKGVDLSRTVSFVASTFPGVFVLPASTDPEAVLQSIREQRRRIPRQGLTYGWMQKFSGEYSRNYLKRFPQSLYRPLIMLNYAGQSILSQEGIIRPARESVTRRLDTPQPAAENILYRLPGLTPGAEYLVRLHFVETLYYDAGERTFNVAINRAAVLADFDIFTAAGGTHVAIVKQFGVVAAADGTIAIMLTPVVEAAAIAAIELFASASGALPAGPHATTGVRPIEPHAVPLAALTPIYRINAGGPAVPPFEEDRYATGGKSSLLARPEETMVVDTRNVPGAAPEEVYRTEQIIEIPQLWVLFDCRALIQDGQFSIDWVYSDNVYRHETVERLASTYLGVLRSLCSEYA